MSSPVQRYDFFPYGKTLQLISNDELSTTLTASLWVRGDGSTGVPEFD